MSANVCAETIVTTLNSAYNMLLLSDFSRLMLNSKSKPAELLHAACACHADVHFLQECIWTSVNALLVLLYYHNACLLMLTCCAQ